jgi:hypothetical protein
MSKYICFFLIKSLRIDRYQCIYIYILNSILLYFLHSHLNSQYSICLTHSDFNIFKIADNLYLSRISYHKIHEVIIWRILYLTFYLNILHFKPLKKTIILIKYPNPIIHYYSLNWSNFMIDIIEVICAL